MAFCFRAKIGQNFKFCLSCGTVLDFFAASPTPINRGGAPPGTGARGVLFACSLRVAHARANQPFYNEKRHWPPYKQLCHLNR
jgi:hypothetical protein